MFGYIKMLAPLGKWLLILVAAGGLSFFSHDYGVKETELKYKEIELLTMEANQKQQLENMQAVQAQRDRAFEAEQKYANQKPKVEIRYIKTQEKVNDYAQNNLSKRCISNDTQWMRIRARAISNHNGKSESELIPATSNVDDSSASSTVQRDIQK